MLEDEDTRAYLFKLYPPVNISNGDSLRFVYVDAHLYVNHNIGLVVNFYRINREPTLNHFMEKILLEYEESYPTGPPGPFNSLFVESEEFCLKWLLYRLTIDHCLYLKEDPIVEKLSEETIGALEPEGELVTVSDSRKEVARLIDGFRRRSLMIPSGRSMIKI